MDINPFSLGVSVKNESKDKEIQKEGEEMSAIIKRGSILPTFNKCEYQTVKDNQTTVRLKIYEGEKKYVKYNHLLKETLIEGLTPKPKGQTKISVEFKIDANGILSIKAVETSVKDGKYINLTIKNDEISFSKEQMEKLKQKMEDITKNIKHKGKTQGMDYSNLKEILKTYLDAYKECNDDEEDDKKLYLNNFNEAMEEFIDAFDNLYIKELFISSYMEYLKLTLSAGEKRAIFKKIEKYLTFFIDKSSGYLNNLLEILSPLQNGILCNEFYKIVINIMEKLNNCGKERIKKINAFFKYQSLMYFEQSLHYYDIYLSQQREARFDPQSLQKMKEQKQISVDFIKNIKSDAILLADESIIKGRKFDKMKMMFESINSGVTEALNKLSVLNYADISKNTELVKSAIKELEDILARIQITDKPSITEAKCIAYILKLNQILGNISHKTKYIFALADRCKYIIEHSDIDERDEWYKEFKDLYEKIQTFNTQNADYNNLLERVKQRDPSDFNELDEEFNKNKGTIKFIKYLLEKHPYPNYENDKNNKVIDFDDYSIGLIEFLMKKYQPERYMPGNANNERNYCLKHEISSKLSNLLTKIQQ